MRRMILNQWFAALADDLVDKTSTLDCWTMELGFDLECVNKVPPAAVTTQAPVPEQVDSDTESRPTRHASTENTILVPIAKQTRLHHFGSPLYRPWKPR